MTVARESFRPFFRLGLSPFLSWSYISTDELTPPRQIPGRMNILLGFPARFLYRHSLLVELPDIFFCHLGKPQCAPRVDR